MRTDPSSAWDAARAARIVAQAHREDPAVRWIFPDPAHRDRPLRWTIDRWVRIMGPPANRGAQNAHGAAIWVAPGSSPDQTLWQQLRHGLLKGPLVLGPRGLMSNPKLGTVTQDVAAAVSDAKGGQVQYRVEKAGIIHAGVGKTSFTGEQIAGNARALYDAVVRAKPSGAKGTYIKKVSLSSTMGPGLRVDPSTLSQDAGAAGA